MARARNIKPKFFENEDLGALDPLARLLFIGLWTIADFKGCLEYRPPRIKAQILPYDSCDVVKLMKNLDNSGFISIYSVQGKQYIKIMTFEEHQNPHKNERDTGSKFPDIIEKDCENKELENIEINRDKNGTARADSLFPLPDSLLLKPDTCLPESPPSAEYSEDFERAWDEYPSRPGSSKKDAYKAWKARIAKGAAPEHMIDGAIAYAKYVKAKGSDPEFIKSPVTFFGPGDHYAADWTIRASAGPPQYQTANDKAKALADRLTGKHKNEQPDLIDINPGPSRIVG